MRITARAIEGKPGCAEILIDGKRCEEIRCKAGTARVAGAGMLSLTAFIKCPAEKKKAKEAKNGNNSGNTDQVDS